jgi:serine/threonine protein kinase
MALVVLATDTRTGRNVALKLVPIGVSGEARDILEAEQLGRRVAAAVQSDQHARPAGLRASSNESGYFLVAMEYLDGENLSDLISRGPVPISRAVAIAWSCARSSTPRTTLRR